ncbi:DASH complex subunit Ask1-domain-containing protein [Papiliotrema laurentii]|uniref:DASH complex subunit ASK1 n=1 Tax=Papiliotrema laurentii TaxID=5418 RepID=A0AAD9CUV7_PAPLA|nr:DASH complex subunit Ask1-domain-containing protein [Papiliotrema laurentii]
MVLSMSSLPYNPLLSHPFFQIQGIDPSSPISAQIQQIDQLNTLLLQEIDANFARFHQIITSRILPEIKRFAIGAEPIRETSQLWRSFFEAAAAQRFDLDGDSSAFGPSGRSHYDDDTVTIAREDTYLSSAQEEGSFIFQPATSSTPLPGRTHMDNRSWEDSIESPFERMDRNLEDLKWGEGNYNDSSSAPTPSLPSGYSLPGFSAADASYDISTGTVEPPDLPRTREQPRATTCALDTPKAKTAEKWNGITDLRHTPLNAKFGNPKAKQTFPPPKSSLASDFDDLSLDDSDDDLKMTMSPPVTMKFALPPRAQAMLDLAKTPRKGCDSGTVGNEDPAKRQGEARMIVDDLLEAMSSGSPAIPEPKEFGRYSIVPPEFASARRLFDGPPGGAISRKSVANTSFGSDIIDHDQPNDSQPTYADEDSFDEDDDDSFDSAFGQTVRQPLPETHMTAQEDGEYGDVTSSSIGNVSDGNVFDAPRQPGGPSAFNLMKQDEMHTYRGGKLEDAAGAELHWSPTIAHVNNRR